MLSAGELTEGYAAIRCAWRFAEERGVRGLPLLEAIHAVIWENADVGETLAALRFE
jgi:glycerol-3-phosphate dehydrogenase